MNIFLVPYTWHRHLALGWVCAAAGLIAWWAVLGAAVVHPLWTLDWDGPVFLGTVGGAVAGASVLAEQTLHRRALWKRALFPLLAGFLSAGAIVAGYWMWTRGVGPMVLSGDAASDLADPTLVALRYRLPAWLAAGVGTAFGPTVLRRGRGFLAHGAAGAAAGGIGGCVWYLLGYTKSALGYSDLYYASAYGAMALGLAFGLLAWGIPDALYAGWLRVVTDTRHARRIPVDGLDARGRERFIGHFPVGLDLFLPSEEGVAELHVSVMVNARQRYRARGLTLAPTVVRRFLERVDLRYDPKRSAPLETELSSGDRILCGPPENPTIVEFLMLPKEER